MNNDIAYTIAKFVFDLSKHRNLVDANNIVAQTKDDDISFEDWVDFINGVSELDEQHQLEYLYNADNGEPIVMDKKLAVSFSASEAIELFKSFSSSAGIAISEY